MNNSIIHFLLTIKNAGMARKEITIITNNKINVDLVTLLYKEGFLQSFTVNEKQNTITIFLRYGNNKNVFKELKLVSTPSRLIYLNYLDLCQLYDKKMLLVFSTDKGFFTGLECKKNKIGGKFLFIC